MKTYTKDDLVTALKSIADMGWIENRRHGNPGGIGNTLEDLLGIEETNIIIYSNQPVFVSVVYGVCVK